MAHFWFDVFTRATWDEARAIDFAVSGFSKSKLATVRRVQPGDVLICYLKGEMELIGALKVTGAAYVAQEPRIWQSQVFPARLPVEPLIVLDDEHPVDFLALLPMMSFYDADNIRRTWARLQGSPTALSDKDGQIMLDALSEAAAAQQLVPQPVIKPDELPKTKAPSRTTQPPVALLDPIAALI